MSPLLDVQLVDPPARGYADEWIPLTLALKCPPGIASGIVIKNVSCVDRNVHLDTDLLTTDIPIGPGEVYQFRLPLRVDQPHTIALEKINIQTADATRDELVDLPSWTLQVLPAIAREIEVRVESLCAYDSGTKVDLTIKHVGAAQFADLTVTLGPEGSIRAGKRVLRFSTFLPGQEEHVDIVIFGSSFDITMAAQVAGVGTFARVSATVPQISSRSDRERFRFLEPRRLSADQKVLKQVCGEETYAVEPIHAAYPMEGGEKYILQITPPDAAVTDIQLEEIKGVVNLRTAERSEDKRSWKFFLDVTANALFSKPERLFYTVIRPDETLKGEVHLCLRPERGRHLRLAAALGVAVTLQGFGAVFKFLANSEYSMPEAVSHFHIGSDYQLLFPICIPLLWLGLRVHDWVQYRLQG